VPENNEEEKKPAVKAKKPAARKKAAGKKTAKPKKGERSGKILLVESPTKVNTIKKFLKGKFNVMATKGHVIDLPKSRLGVNIENNFEPEYIVMRDKKKILKEMLKEIKGVETVYIGTDPDREGEAICWHVATEIKKASGENGPNIHRVLFNEITQNAVLKAIDNPLEINLNLVNAQQARRVLDRLVGYTISPLLWKAIKKGLSAGRVQSVALKLIVDRQKEIDAFVPVEYWSLKAALSTGKKEKFEAKLVEKNGEKTDLKNSSDSQAVVEELKGAEYKVTEVQKKERRRKALPPFITSTLQQEAARRFRFTAQKTMMIAQQLYEGINIEGEGQTGLITYMRTDSLRVSADAQAEALNYIREKLGADYVPETPNVYKSKKSSQDAHEAIRPSSVLRHPDAIKASLDNDQYRIYGIIWKRFVASQMTQAVFDDTKAKITAGNYAFNASGSVKKFDGFLKVYEEQPAEDENKEDSASEEDNKQAVLPLLNEGDILELLELIPGQHFTQPPPYYSDATLVKALEEKDIGRPSTYAPIISTLVYRKYVDRERGRFVPTDLGKLVASLLISGFSEFINEQFTAEMEDKLDSIEEGKIEWHALIADFYGKLVKLVEAAQPAVEEMRRSIENEIDATCEKCGGRMIVKWGRFGKFISCENYPNCKNAKPLNGEKEETVTDEKCPECGAPLIIKQGPYGSFMACSKYPDCKYTKQIVKKTGVKCPECAEGEIIERTFRKTRKFYGCSSYPKCKFMTWDKPINEPCPKCGAPFILEKWRKNAVTTYCMKCDYKAEKDSVQDE